ncbi:hypothetical protein [Luteolibacter sp. Populi]|uniref:hypothetical protein n=1 Tax=Luteolibacter sp. Populi TaxID=3230487 RepID=UPI003466486E
MFPLEYLPAVFQMILKEWPNFTRPSSARRLENQISNRFVGHLKQVARVARTPFNFKYRSKIADPQADSESGELDIEVFTGLDTDVYFAFECKRLFNRIGASEAGKYVGNGGMGCYLTGQYSGSANCGGMIGYVMTGDPVKAEHVVRETIELKKEELRLLDPFSMYPSSLIPDEGRVSQTLHAMGDEVFTIYHIFLPYSAGPSGAPKGQ